jgi:hypothetical protein
VITGTKSFDLIHHHDAILFDIILSQALYHSGILLSFRSESNIITDWATGTVALLCEFQCGSYESTSHLNKTVEHLSFSDWYTAGRYPSSHHIRPIVLRVAERKLFFGTSSSHLLIVIQKKTGRSKLSNCDVDDEEVNY